MDTSEVVVEEEEHAFKNQQGCNQRLPLPLRELLPAFLPLETDSRQSNRKCQATITEQQNASCQQSQDVRDVKHGNKSQVYCLSPQVANSTSVIFHPRSGGGHI